MNVFKYYSTDFFVPTLNSIEIHISSNIKSKEDLLDYFSEKLKFPDYFGKNWDALYDCLVDLSWIKEKKIIILHDEINFIETNDLTIYLKILCDVINKWSDSEEHTFEAFF